LVSNQSGFSTGWLGSLGAVVVLEGALDSSVPSVVDCVLAGAVDAGTVAVSAVLLLTSVWVPVAVASVMVVVGWCFD
jgi:hypothetical protein